MGRDITFYSSEVRNFLGCFQNMNFENILRYSKLRTKIGDIITKKGRVNKINSGGSELDFDR